MGAAFKKDCPARFKWGIKSSIHRTVLLSNNERLALDSNFTLSPSLNSHKRIQRQLILNFFLIFGIILKALQIVRCGSKNLRIFAFAAQT
jgi:hypothetical protein